MAKPPETSLPPPADDIEAELAGALPETQGARFPAFLQTLIWRLVAIMLLAGAAYVLWREFRETSLEEIAAAFAALGWQALTAAAALSAVSFLIMGAVEWLGLRWAGAAVPLPRALGVSFMASAIGHSLGANLIVAGAVRARAYARDGVTIRQVAATTMFQGFAFTMGMTTLAGLALVLAASEDIAAASRISNPVADAVGAGLLMIVVTYMLLCARRRAPIRVLGHTFTLPSLRVAQGQTILGAVDNAVAAAILWVLLPPGSIEYLTFVTTYAPSVVLGLVSHVPGGAGVFEGTVSTLMKNAPPASLAAAFLGYRLFFFLIPLTIAGLALGLDGMRDRPRRPA